MFVCLSVCLACKWWQGISSLHVRSLRSERKLLAAAQTQKVVVYFLYRYYIHTGIYTPTACSLHGPTTIQACNFSFPVLKWAELIKWKGGEQEGEDAQNRADGSPFSLSPPPSPHLFYGEISYGRSLPRSKSVIFLLFFKLSQYPYWYESNLLLPGSLAASTSMRAMKSWNRNHHLKQW